MNLSITNRGSFRILTLAALLLGGACSSTPDVSEANRRVHAQIAAGEAEAARQQLEIMPATDSIVTTLLLAQSAFETGRFDEAIGHYDGLLTQPLKPAVREFTLSNLAAAQRVAGRPDDAYATLGELAQFRPTDGDLRLLRAATALELGDLDAARAHLRGCSSTDRARAMDLLGVDFLASTPTTAALTGRR